MTHLIIADRVADCICIPGRADFLLGSIAPDCVHFNTGFNAHLKHISHLRLNIEEDKKEDNDEWTANVVAFMQQTVSGNNFSFILGYASHILADIRNDLDIVKPAKRADV